MQYECQYQNNGFYFRSNQNFSKVARLVDQYGSAVILKQLTSLSNFRIQSVDEQLSAQTDDVLAISENLITRNKAVYEELAK